MTGWAIQSRPFLFRVQDLEQNPAPTAPAGDLQDMTEEDIEIAAEGVNPSRSAMPSALQSPA